jgi:hypothetical protein
MSMGSALPRNTSTDADGLAPKISRADLSLRPGIDVCRCRRSIRKEI